MNAFESKFGGDGRDEPEIILIAVEQKNYFVYKGEEHLNQLLLADGTFPKPILCVNFESLFNLSIMIGDGFNISQCWGIHPEIVQRLRDTGCLIETEAE